MATQQVLFAETIAGMKKAFKRKAYDSDSDSEIESYGNRGHKLKRRARFAHKGQLVPTEGPSAYRENIDYAGVQRPIIHRNPPLVDEDGYEIDSEDDDDRIEEAMSSAAELNPYSNIRIENVLAPLTASTDLPTHPTLSKPFTSQNLTDLVLQSSSMMRRENESLWQARHLWTALCGDHTWAPCETMIGPSDVELYTDDHAARHLLGLSKTSTAGDGETTSQDTVNGTVRNDQDEPDATQGTHENQSISNTNDADVSMADASVAEGNKNGSTVDENTLSEASAVKKKEGDADESMRGNGGANNRMALINGNKSTQDPARAETNEKAESKTQKDGAEANNSNRAGNNAPSVASEALEQSFVHPMFLPPAGATPDRNLGLPESEAEEVRKFLALFVQKQEEVCRGVQRLHDGLNKAHRLRSDVLHWSKAEAHSGANRDMSDGEDWYDKEEWGLTEDLKKGHDDEEEDTTTTAKKTRARR